MRVGNATGWFTAAGSEGRSPEGLRPYNRLLARRLRLFVVGALLAAPLFFAFASGAQNPEVMLPEQSAAKAKELIQQTIQALGGPAYLAVRDATCTGRFAVFDRYSAVGGYDRFLDYVKLPDKNRTEFSKKRNIIQVHNGNQGWELDRGGVIDAPADSIENFLESQKKDLDNLLRFRLNEEGMIFRYGGGDLVDLRLVDWVEVVDRERRTTRVAIERSTHLPMRAVFITRDRRTRERIEETAFYSNYHPVQGVQTPLRLARERNGRKTLELFYEDCSYNTGLADALFTRESLEQRFAELDKKNKKKKK